MFRILCIRTEYGDLRPEIYVFSPNIGEYGPEKTPYLETFHALHFESQSIFIAVTNYLFYHIRL